LPPWEGIGMGPNPDQKKKSHLKPRKKGQARVGRMIEVNGKLHEGTEEGGWPSGNNEKTRKMESDPKHKQSPLRGTGVVGGQKRDTGPSHVEGKSREPIISSEGQPELEERIRRRGKKELIPEPYKLRKTWTRRRTGDIR